MLKCVVFCSVLSPLGLSKVVAYFAVNQTEISTKKVYEYAGILFFLSLGNSFVSGNLRAWEATLGVRIQVALRSFLFRKSLKLPCGTNDINVGNLVTLITKDINILEKNIWMIKDLLLFFIKFGTSSYLLYRKIGMPASIGIGFLIVAVLIQGMLRFNIFRNECLTKYSTIKKIFICYINQYQYKDTINWIIDSIITPNVNTSSTSLHLITQQIIKRNFIWNIQWTIAQWHSWNCSFL